ncbi:DUF7511 domain-containing protein [Haloprofundus halophilus]|uniref:DUF7511 domain-containing protein n=1 Tax=Haloprofundus halophilus TaxID=2283527 RepID=UPI000E433678|nr:hypothetical protein [Haloprofundus halophilus]
MTNEWKTPPELSWLFEVDHVISPSSFGPDRCTLFPADATDEELLTTWVSADEGAYVPLDEML